MNKLQVAASLTICRAFALTCSERFITSRLERDLQVHSYGNSRTRHQTRKQDLGSWPRLRIHILPAQTAKVNALLAYRLFYPEDFPRMSSYGSAYSGQLHPTYQPQPQPQQQRARSYSNPPYPSTSTPAPYPQQQTSYFPPPPTAPYLQGPLTSNPIAIPASNRKRASSDYAQGYGTSPSQPQASGPYANSCPTHHLQPIPQQHLIPENYQYPPQQQQPMVPGSPGYSHDRRRSSSSQYGYDPRQSYGSAHSYQSAHSHQGRPSPDYYARHNQNGHGNYDDRYNSGDEREGHAYAHTHGHTHAAPEPPKGYGDWDRDEVARYQKNQDLERRPTLGGSLMSFVKRIGGSDRR